MDEASAELHYSYLFIVNSFTDDAKLNDLAGRFCQWAGSFSQE